MSPSEPHPIETLEAWLSNKPYWEQYVWKINLEKDTPTDSDIEQCYQYLCEHFELHPALPSDRPPVSFKNIPVDPDNSPSEPPRARIARVKDFENVNAIPKTCSIPFGTNLTLIYGGNGSGKSGVAKILCDACFSRGEREILPNIRLTPTARPAPKAVFVLDDGSILKFSGGERHDVLKRYSVFDSKSVLIHLDESNRVNFTPSQIRIFDKVAATISKLEDKLAAERRARKTDNPFQGMFLDNATSSTAVFCKGITGNTKIADFLTHATFDPAADEDRIKDLEQQIETKKKLDIPKRKSQLVTDRASLSALKQSLARVTDRLSSDKRGAANHLVSSIIGKRAITEALSTSTFDDGILKTVGSAEWKALLVAAKALRDNEQAVTNSEPTHCLLCHQVMTDESNALFLRYWKFLESKAESELSELLRQRTAATRELQLLKAIFPQFLETDAGIGTLDDDDPAYVTQLRTQFRTLETVLDAWIQNLEELREITDELETPNLSRIDIAIARKLEEETKLIDPASEIVNLTSQLNSLKDRKDVAAVKDAALKYIDYLQWLSKANVNFSSIRMATTKKRTEWFLAGVASGYRGVFNEELSELGCDFNLVMHTSGDQGNTVKEYRLDFAEDFSPSQILSEGEQNACALADFLTEVQLDKNNSGIIFDDPVTSLDHQRKGKIAHRLALEASSRQVIVFTHDLPFTSQLVKHAADAGIPVTAHWMRKVAGIPGHVDENTSPSLATLASQKKECSSIVQSIENFSAKDQERALENAFSHLRSCCESLIEEILFAGAFERWSDHVKVQNLEEMIVDQDLVLRIVALHGRLSEFIPAHNRSDVQREDPLSKEDFDKAWADFEKLERDLKEEQKKAKTARSSRKAAQKSARVGWT